LLSDPQAWLALATLTLLEIVLGIDNIIFITILVGRLPAHQQARARFCGLAMAMLMRIGLLLSLTWVMGLTEPLFSVLSKGISGRDIILLGGGLFLIFKSVTEIHHALEGEAQHAQGQRKRISFIAVITQIAVIDIIFSLDSVITTVGLADDVEVMIAAIVIAVLVMMMAAKAIGDFVEKHPTLKMLALSFLIMIGTALLAEGLGFHVPKGYIYFSMAFAVAVEALNIRVRKVSVHPVKLLKTEI
jgi:predicted tellurium resistance membrane protein TerC